MDSESSIWRSLEAPLKFQCGLVLQQLHEPEPARAEPSRAMGTGTLSRAGLSQPARSGSAAAAAVGTRWQLAYLCPLYFWSYACLVQ